MQPRPFGIITRSPAPNSTISAVDVDDEAFG